MNRHVKVWLVAFLATAMTLYLPLGLYTVLGGSAPADVWAYALLCALIGAWFAAVLVPPPR